MIKLEKTEVIGWEHAIRGMRNPKNSWPKIDSGYYNQCDECASLNDYIVGTNDHKLMMDLASGGPVHAKYRRMIAVYVDITAPLYWWKEFDTYKVGTVANSCSTMHKIHDKEFTLEDFSCEHLMVGDESFAYPLGGGWRGLSALSVLRTTIEALNNARKRYIETKDKKYWWQMIQLLPSSYNQKRTVMLNYEVLANIYEWRKNHKLDEWHVLCEWIEKLPYAELITGNSIIHKVADEEKTESSPLKEYSESIEDILKRADVEWFIDPILYTRTVISKSDKPLTEAEKEMLKRMWENQGDRLHTIFKE